MNCFELGDVVIVVMISADTKETADADVTIVFDDDKNFPAHKTLSLQKR